MDKTKRNSLTRVLKVLQQCADRRTYAAEVLVLLATLRYLGRFLELSHEVHIQSHRIFSTNVIETFPSFPVNKKQCDNQSFGGIITNIDRTIWSTQRTSGPPLERILVHCLPLIAWTIHTTSASDSLRAVAWEFEIFSPFLRTLPLRPPPRSLHSKAKSTLLNPYLDTTAPELQRRWASRRVGKVDDVWVRGCWEKSRFKSVTCQNIVVITYTECALECLCLLHSLNLFNGRNKHE